jgi:hypothetical protein
MMLKVPGLEFSSIRAYQFREKELSSIRHYGQLHANGHITMGSVSGYSVKNSRAWRIAFKNISHGVVNVMLHFSIHDLHGKRDDFSKVVRNLRPNEPADVDLTLSQKANKILLTTIEVFGDEEQLISRTEVNRFLPRMIWGPKAWVVGLILAYVCVMLNVDFRPNNNLVNCILPLFGLTLMGAGLAGRTPVVALLLFLAVLPFSNHPLEHLGVMAAVAVVYLVVVWNRRRSVGDFFRGTATV